MYPWLIQMSTSAAMVIAALLPIMNPLGGAPVFLGMTGEASDKDRAWLASRVAINTAIINMSSLLLGSYMLAFFGISEGAVRVAGGFMVISFAWELNKTAGVPAGRDVDQHAKMDRSSLRMQAFYPLAFPLTTGAGCISIAITLGAHVLGMHGEAKWFALGGAAIGIFLSSLTVFICYRFAARLLSLLGETGSRVMLRLAAFILMCIGVQIFWEGVRSFIREI